MDEPDPVGQSPLDESDALLDSLDLENLRIQASRPKKEFYCAYERDLTVADLAALDLPRGAKTRPLLQIRASHHSLARCLATGMKPAQAALVTGHRADRIPHLLTDPAFASLVADYRNEAKGVFADLADRMNDLSLDAIELLQERLHDNPENFTVPVLLDMIKAFADRTGHGPGQEVHLKVDRDFIDRPPRESFDEWKARRDQELKPEPPLELKKLN